MNSIGILYTLRNSSEPSKNNVSADNSSLKFEIMAKQLYVASQRVL